MITQENIPYTADEIKAMVKTIEELRKKYNGALERAKVYHTGGSISDAHITEVIFPELKEIEEERIKKALIKILNEIVINTNYKELGIDYNIRDMIAWLEKQGEKITKPKFKVGDWITDGQLTCKVLSITDKSYELHLHNDDYCHFETDIQSVDKYYRLWAIQDAKDGDVLVCEDENFTIPFIAIYKCLGDTVYNYKGLKDLTFNSHCFMGFNGNFYEGEGGHVIEGIHPGAKEQRNLLFQKMKEAGYEWDADKKELKKIEVASKESEDERIRKGLIKAVSRIFEGHKLFDTDVTREEALAWLEKQTNKD